MSVIHTHKHHDSPLQMNANETKTMQENVANVKSGKKATATFNGNGKFKPRHFTLHSTAWPSTIALFLFGPQLAIATEINSLKHTYLGY